MNVLYDYQIFNLQKVGGISRYHADLYHGLRDKGVRCNVGTLYTDNVYLNDGAERFNPQFEWWEHFITKKDFRGKGRLALWYSKLKPLKGSSVYNKEHVRAIIRKGGVDIFHPTYYNDLYEDVGLPKTVLTIHDMIFESFPQFFGGLGTIKNKRLLAQKADKIIAVSEYTKSEILKYYDFVKPSMVDVVYHGIDLRQKHKTQKLVNYPYLFFVGQRGGYKNFYFLIRAMRELKKSFNGLKLICVGSPFSESEKVYMQLIQVEDDIRYFGRVSDAELASLYANALAYVSSSLTEGFGIPLLEAMKYESPMLLSDIPVYREVAQKAAVYFDPADELSFCEAVAKIKDDALRLNLINEGSKRVSFFTKERMLENTYNTYKSIL